jgi:hypothetical protein
MQQRYFVPVNQFHFELWLRQAQNSDSHNDLPKPQGYSEVQSWFNSIMLNQLDSNDLSTSRKLEFSRPDPPVRVIAADGRQIEVASMGSCPLLLNFRLARAQPTYHNLHEIAALLN